MPPARSRPSRRRRRHPRHLRRVAASRSCATACAAIRWTTPDRPRALSVCCEGVADGELRAKSVATGQPCAGLISRSTACSGRHPGCPRVGPCAATGFRTGAQHRLQGHILRRSLPPGRVTTRPVRRVDLSGHGLAEARRGGAREAFWASPSVLVMPIGRTGRAGLAARLAGAPRRPHRETSLESLDEGRGAGRKPFPPRWRTGWRSISIWRNRVCRIAPELALDLEALARGAGTLLPRVSIPDSAIAELARGFRGAAWHSVAAPPLQARGRGGGPARPCRARIASKAPIFWWRWSWFWRRARRRFPSAARQRAREEPGAPEDQPDQEEKSDEEDDRIDLPPAELLLEAAKAMLPPDLLARLQAGRGRARQPFRQQATRRGEKGQPSRSPPALARRAARRRSAPSI